MKQCSRCKRELEIKSFVAKGNGIRAGICYRCKYQSRSPESKKRKNLRNNGKKLGYTLSFDDWNSLVLKQKECCAICKEKTNLVVDHDHGTGKVRGLLCSNCNTGLGMLKDSPDILRAASLYLLQDF